VAAAFTTLADQDEELNRQKKVFRNAAGVRESLPPGFSTIIQLAHPSASMSNRNSRSRGRSP
jgi:hypothetical protein